MSTDNTAIAEAPEAAAPEAEGLESELIVHEFDVGGYALSPERVEVPVPKGAACVLLLARSADLGWFVGYTLEAGEDNLRRNCQAEGTGAPNRAVALEQALKAAHDFFAASPKSRLHKKCAGEVEAFARRLTEGRGVSGRAQPEPVAPLPDPQNLEVEVERVEPNPANPRAPITPESVADLAASIDREGLLQPIGVRILPAAEGDGLPGVGVHRLQVLWGHRRLEAYRLLKRAKIPARVYEGITDTQARLALCTENLNRQNLDPIEEARGYADMMRDFSLSVADVAGRTRRSRPVVSNSLRLLNLPASVQARVSSGEFTVAHGVALASYADFPAVCERISDHVAARKLPAGEVEGHLLIEDELRQAGLLTKCPNDYEPPKEIEKSFRKAWSKFGWYCLDKDVWAKEAARLVAEKKAERAAAKEREAKADRNTAKAAAAAKKKELTPEDGTVVGKEDKYLLDLVPEDRVAKGVDWHQNSCLLCLDKAHWQRVLEARRAVLAEDAKAKAAPLLEKAWKTVAGLKKLDGLAAIGLIFQPPAVNRAAAFAEPWTEKIGIDLAKASKRFLEQDGSGNVVWKLSELAKVDPLQLARYGLGAQIDRLERALAMGNIRTFNGPWLRLLAGSELAGLLDETKAKDQAEIVRQVRVKLAPPEVLEMLSKVQTDWKKFKWNKNDVCENPQRFEIKLPKGSACELRLARGSNGNYASAVDLQGRDERGQPCGAASPILRKDCRYPEASAALGSALLHASDWFRGQGSGEVALELEKLASATHEVRSADGGGKK